MTEPNMNVRSAVFERWSTGATLQDLAVKHSVSLSFLTRSYKKWLDNFPDSQPLGPDDIHIPISKPGHPVSLHPDIEQVLVDTVLYFVDACTPLTRCDLLDVVQHVVRQLPAPERARLPFREGRPSKQWLRSFLKRYPFLSVNTMKTFERERVSATVLPIVAEHIARLKAVIDRYRIADPARIFNLDESGVSFRSMSTKSLRKGVGLTSKNLVSTAARVKGSFDRITIMAVVSCSGRAYTPFVVVPGKKPHYRRLADGSIETVHTFLPFCYLHHREPAGVDTPIFENWATEFIKETSQLREHGNKLLLTYDGYSCHIKPSVLLRLRDAGIVVIALPAHTSHFLQPLDVSVFAPFKSYMQRYFHAASRAGRSLSIFDACGIIHDSYESAFVSRNIISGFISTGMWCPEKRGPNGGVLDSIPFLNRGSRAVTAPSVEEIVKTFATKSRSLLSDVAVATGTVRVDSTSGARLTSNSCIAALLAAYDRRRKRYSELRAREDARERRLTYCESSAEIAHLLELSSARDVLACQLNASRKRRRLQASFRAVENGSVTRGFNVLKPDAS